MQIEADEALPPFYLLDEALDSVISCHLIALVICSELRKSSALSCFSDYQHQITDKGDV